MQNKTDQRTRKRAAIRRKRGGSISKAAFNRIAGKVPGREGCATEEQPGPARAVMSFGNLRVNAAHLNEPVV